MTAAAKGTGYSAGAIFLQVVPVFNNIQRAIEDETRNIDRALGDQMEKSGEKAGRRAGQAASKSMAEELSKGSGEFERTFRKNVDEINRALSGIDAQKLGNNLRREVTEIKRELEALKRVDMTIDVNKRRADAAMAELEGRVQAFRDDVKIVFRSDIDHALKGFTKIRALKESIEDPIELEVRTEKAERAMSSFEKYVKGAATRAAKILEDETDDAFDHIKREIKALNQLQIGLDISDRDARQKVRDLTFDLRRLSNTTASPSVRFGAAKLLAEIGTVDAALERLDGKSIDLDTSHAERSLFRLTKNGDDAANSFRSFNIIMLAVAGAGPALVPVLAAIAGGLLAIGPAAGVAAFGLTSVIIGFTGIGDAVKALQQQQDAAVKTTQAGAKSQAAAARAVERAQRSAAKGVESALKRQKNAQERYADSVDSVREAELALAEARRDAANDGQDLQNKIAQNQLSIDQGVLDVFNATVTNDAVQSDGSASNADKEQARIDLEQARLRLKELREEQRQLAEEKRRWDKYGVDGTNSVKNAQERLNDAIDSQRDALDDLRDAQLGVNEAREEGARQIADALAAQADGLAAVDTQQANVDAAFEKLGISGRKFALFIFALKEGFYDFRDAIQEAMLPGIQAAIEGFLPSKSAKILRDAMIGLADGFGRFVQALSISFQGQAWQGFFQMLADLGPEIQAAYGTAFIKLFEALASVLTVLAPFALDFANGLAAIMTSFAEWAASKEGADGIQKFMAYVEQVAPKVIELMIALTGALLNILVALAPYGDLILGFIVSILDFLAAMDPKVLGAFITSLLIFITASQIAYATMNLLLAGTALLGSSVGVLVLGLVAAGLGLAFLFEKGGPVGKVIAIIASAAIAAYLAFIAWNAVLAISAAIQTGFAAATYGAAGATYAQTAAQKLGLLAGRAWMGLTALMTGVQWLWTAALNGTLLSMARNLVATIAYNIYTRALRIGILAMTAAQWLFNGALLANPVGLVILAIIALVAVFVVLYKNNKTVREGIQKAWKIIKNAISKAWDAIKVALEAFGDVVSWLWNDILKPIMPAILDAFKKAFEFIGWAWENILWPVLKIWGEVVWTLWSTIIKVALVLIFAAFKALFIGLKWIWENVLSPVFGAVGDAVGWLWKNAVKPAMDGIGWLFEKAFRGIKWVWDHILSPAFDAIGDALGVLKEGFQTTVDGIGEIWDGLKGIVAKPIKFFIEKVINAGLIRTFNKVADWVGIDGFDEIKPPEWTKNYATGGILEFATGGIMPGYTPGRDVHRFISPTGGQLHLSGGEAIMRPEWTAAVGSGFVDYMNGLARSGGVKAVQSALGNMGGFWRGGILPLPGATVKQHASGYAFPAFDLNVGGGYADYGMGVKAFMDGFVRMIENLGDASYGRFVQLQHDNGISTLYAHLSGFANSLSLNDRVRAGQTIGYVGDLGNTGEPPTSHLHFEMRAPGQDLVATTDRKSSWVPGWLMDIVKNPFGAVKDWVGGPIKNAAKTLTESPIWGVATGLPGKLIKGATDKVWDIIPGWVKTAAGWAGEAASWVGNGVGNVIDGAGNVITGGAGLIGDGFNAVFKDGGILPYNGTMKYDNGGYLPPGITQVVNLTGRPEPVFTASQWDNMESGTGGGETYHYEPHFDGSNLTSEDVGGDMNFQMRRLRRRGKYAKAGS